MVNTSLAIANHTVTTGVYQYTFPFKIPDDSQIEVFHVVDSVLTTLVLNTDFTVSGIGEDSGHITLLPDGLGNYLTTGTLSIRRSATYLQDENIVEFSKYPAAALERGLDKLAMQIQSLREIVTRSILTPLYEGVPERFDLPGTASRANKFLAFNGSGDPVAADGAGQGVPHTDYILPLHGAISHDEAQEAIGITEYARSLLDDATAAAALTTLGVSEYIKGLLDDTDATSALATLGLTVSTFIKTLLDDATAAAAATTLGLGTGNSPTFAAVNTGQGANELHPMDQPVRTTDSVAFGVVTTGQIDTGVAVLEGATTSALIGAILLPYTTSRITSVSGSMLVGTTLWIVTAIRDITGNLYVYGMDTTGTDTNGFSPHLLNPVENIKYSIAVLNVTNN